MFPKKNIQTLSITQCDMRTGEILCTGLRNFDFRYHRDRRELHRLLDLFIDSLVDSSRLHYIDFQQIQKPNELNIPF